MVWKRAILVVAGLGTFAALVFLEVGDEPALTLTEMLLELIEPTLMTLVFVLIAYLFGRTKQQHREQLSLMQDLERARTQGARWRAETNEQARCAYRKAGVSGRTALSAFFLEDLLLPIDQSGALTTPAANSSQTDPARGPM